MDITRRDFVAAAAVAAGSLLLPEAAQAGMMGGGGMTGGGMGGGGMGGGGCGGGTGTIDPPIGGAFRDLPVISRQVEPGLVEATLSAKRATISVGGTNANMWTYNGLYPSGIIRGSRDDVVRVNITNNLPVNTATNMLGHRSDSTNLHAHGLHVTPGFNPNGTRGDNVMYSIAPGQSMVHEYDLSMHRPGTLNFYHPHVHGCVAEQVWGGMVGPLVVDDDVDALAGYPTHVMMLTDVTISSGAPAPHSSWMDYMMGKEGNKVLVNGVVNPRLYIAPGQVQRWRFCNASVARFYRLSLQGHEMHVVGTEGGLLRTPYPVTEMLLSPGERLDVLVKANGSGTSYKLLSLPYDRGCGGGGQQVTLMTLTYSGQKRTDSLPTVVDASASRVSMDTSMLPRKKAVLSMGMRAGYINGIQFTGHDQTEVFHSDVGSWEVWEIVNGSNMDHPFHHHINPAQVLSISGGDAGYRSFMTSAPAWKDVTIVPKMGTIELLIPVMDYAGMAMVHCHILAHEDIGMMAIWDMMDGGMPMP